MAGGNVRQQAGSLLRPDPVIGSDEQVRAVGAGVGLEASVSLPRTAAPPRRTSRCDSAAQRQARSERPALRRPRAIGVPSVSDAVLASMIVSTAAADGATVPIAAAAIIAADAVPRCFLIGNPPPGRVDGSATPARRQVVGTRGAIVGVRRAESGWRSQLPREVPLSPNEEVVAGAHGSRTHRATPSAAPPVLKTGGAHRDPSAPARGW